MCAIRLGNVKCDGPSEVPVPNVWTELGYHRACILAPVGARASSTTLLIEKLIIFLIKLVNCFSIISNRHCWPNVRGIRRWPVNSPHKRPVTRKMFPFNDDIMSREILYTQEWRTIYTLPRVLFWGLFLKLRSLEGWFLLISRAAKQQWI